MSGRAFGLIRAAQRRLASGHAHSSSGGNPYTENVSVHAPSKWYTWVGTGMGAVMWCWIFWRAKQDGAALLGLKHPWEGHDDHGHGHGHGHADAHATPAAAAPAGAAPAVHAKH